MDEQNPNKNDMEDRIDKQNPNKNDTKDRIDEQNPNNSSFASAASTAGHDLGTENYPAPELQIRETIEDYSKIFFLISQ